ncbi:Activator of basal transcription 1, partial [Coemansia sp. RSA 2675]
MKPIKVRQMLQKYGDIGRIYLVEEDDQRRKWRIKRATILNNTNMGGGKKHGFYHEDLWDLKYLSRFKRRHLAEQLAGDRNGLLK